MIMNIPNDALGVVKYLATCVHTTVYYEIKKESSGECTSRYSMLVFSDASSFTIQNLHKNIRLDNRL